MHGLALAGWFLGHAPVANFVIADASMLPVLHPGDELLVNRWARLVAGDVVVLRDPAWPQRYLVKRVGECRPGSKLVVLGDNSHVSRDSRTFGPVPRELVVGRVIFRYLPSARRGRIEPNRPVVFGLFRMDTVLAILALLASLVALALVFRLQSSVRRWLELPLAHAAPHEHVSFEQELGSVRQELDRVQREVAELKAAVETVPAPPLPKGRAGGLDDLRAQLRAAHRESERTPDE